jgi:membrane protein implicated in regulation of membrane protease activity
MDISISVSWLLLGLLFVAIEAFGLPSVGFLFAGLAAIIVSVLLEGNVLDASNSTLCIGIWFLITTCFAIILWKPMKKWRTTKHSATHTSNGMIGDKAIILNKDLEPLQLGAASWSGTIMNARLAPSQSTTITVGTEATITAVEGNTLILSTHVHG